jgi:DNA-binding NarL/FixJ family response regulator
MGIGEYIVGALQVVSITSPIAPNHGSAAASSTATPAAVPARAAVVVLDPLGAVFTTLRELGLTVSLWRVLDAKRLPALSSVDLAVLAVYDRIDWSVADTLVERAPTLAISTNFSREDATTSLGHGLIGYLDASLSVDALRRAVSGVLKGEPAYARDITGMWLRARRASTAHAERSVDLTPRQRQIVALIARGGTDKEIASALGIATATAQKHVTNILERLNVPNRAAAVAVIAGHGIL